MQKVLSMTLKDDIRAIEDRLLDLEDERLDLEKDLQTLEDQRQISVGQSLGLLIRPLNPYRS